MKPKTECSSSPNINRETDPIILNKRQKIDHDSSHDDDTILNNHGEKTDRQSSDAEASQTNENYNLVDPQGDQKDQITLRKRPPSPKGSDASNDSVRSKQVSGAERQFELVLVAGGREVKANRSILSERSPFFKNLLRGEERSVRLDMKDFARDFEVSFDALVAVLVGLYGGNVSSLRPEGAHVCADEECDHVACWPVVDFLVGVLYASFVFQIPELVARYQRHLLDIIDKIAADDILVVLPLAYSCGKEFDGLLTRCIDIMVRSDVDIITLDRTLPAHMVKRIVNSRKELASHRLESSGFPDNHAETILRALDSHDTELVGMLIKDDACVLHYAVAYCDAKITTKILGLAIADVNHRNPRGYTVLHIAAMRKEPKIIVSLLTKGAQPAALTPDGRKAVTISKRLTRAVDYKKSTEQLGKESPKDRLCIEILEQAEVLEEPSASLPKDGDDLRMMSEYFECRVALAKLLFPAEANVAMDVAQADGSFEPLNRIRALAETVKLGKRFFPRCSKVINDMICMSDLSEIKERRLKNQVFRDVHDAVTEAYHVDTEELGKFINISFPSKAFHKDKEELDEAINISSSPLFQHGQTLDYVQLNQSTRFSSSCELIQGLTLQLGQQIQPSMYAINHGMNVISEAQKDNLSSLEPLQKGDVVIQRHSSDQLSLDPSNNGQKLVAAEQNMIVACKINSVRSSRPLPIEDREQIPKLNSDLPSDQSSASVGNIKPGFQDANMVIIKAKYAHYIIKFRLSMSSKLEELQQEVAKRLHLEDGTYYVLYKDELNEWILIACDEDLQDCIHTSRSLGNKSIVVLLKPKQSSINLNPTN